MTDKKFAKYTKQYAKDNARFFKDFAAAFQKLEENGVPWPDADGVGLSRAPRPTRPRWATNSPAGGPPRDPPCDDPYPHGYEPDWPISRERPAVSIDGREGRHVTESDSSVMSA